MALTKYCIGDLIELVDERNEYGLKSYSGINIHKEFMPTVANTEGLDETKYKVVRNGRFVFSGMQTGRDECIRIGMYDGKDPIIVSPAYFTFEVVKTEYVIPLYLFMFFLSKERDRLGWFMSDSSIRSNLDWDRFCEIEINLPDLPVQKKFVDIYKSLQENQESYEQGLEDLKLACESLIEKNKGKVNYKTVGEILVERDVRNEGNLYFDVQGINIYKRFMPSVADTNGIDLSKYKVVANNQFAFSGMQTGRDKCIRIALYDGEKPIIISPAYSVFEIKDENVLPEYFMLWFSRNEIDRYGWFMSDSSIRSNLDLDRFFEMRFPVPDKKMQKTIVNIYTAYIERRKMNEKLYDLIKRICPILIRGSLQYGG